MRRHSQRVPWVTVVAVLGVFLALALSFGILHGLMGTALLLGSLAAFHAFAFAWHYRKVRWEESPWGKHVMRFSLLIGTMFALTVGLNLLALLGWSNAYFSLGLTVVLYAIAVWELRERRHLEQRAQKMLRARKA